MTNQEMLEKAIQKAIDGGWTGDRPIYDEQMGQWYITDGDGGYIVPSIVELIYDHGFARALWGDDYVVFTFEDGSTKRRLFTPGDSYRIPKDGNNQLVAFSSEEGWKHHLQKMVVVEDPIQYLGESLK